MSEAGYTLGETLAALVVIGLTAGGVGLGMQVVGRQQSAVATVVTDTQQSRAVEVWLERRFAEQAPFRAHEAERFAGDASEFRFDCGASEPCVAQMIAEEGGRKLVVTGGEAAAPILELPSEAPLRFVYRGATAPLAAWPPEGGTREALRSVALVQGADGAEQVLFEVRVRLEQPLDCAFDPVIQDCR